MFAFLNSSIVLKMVSLKRCLPVIVLLLTIQMFIGSRQIYEKFVPFNSFFIPDKDDLSFSKTQLKFKDLTSLVNTGVYSIPYDLTGDLVPILESILNSFNLGKFHVISVETKKAFVLFSVVVQDIETFALTSFSRVDFQVDSLNPFLLKKVYITPNDTPQFTQFVTPLTPLDSQFRIKNQLHLFAPYDTSDNEKILSDGDNVLLKNVFTEKDYELRNKFN
jgi:hypothetical protein